jgi:hypothetical protein
MASLQNGAPYMFPGGADAYAPVYARSYTTARRPETVYGGTYTAARVSEKSAASEGHSPEIFNGSNFVNLSDSDSVNLGSDFPARRGAGRCVRG